MVVKVAINGFGRIGRCLFRFLWEMEDVGEMVVLPFVFSDCAFPVVSVNSRDVARRSTLHAL